jgi:hypothetical protein
MYRESIDPTIWYLLSAALSLTLIITFFVIAYRLKIIKNSAKFLYEFYRAQAIKEGWDPAGKFLKFKVCRDEDCEHINEYLDIPPEKCRKCSLPLNK